MILAKWGTLKKPFWESTEEMDVGLIADAMVTSFRFLGEEECIPIISQALLPEMSDAVKISAIKACITLVTEVRIGSHPASSDEFVTHGNYFAERPSTVAETSREPQVVRNRSPVRHLPRTHLFNHYR